MNCARGGTVRGEANRLARRGSEAGFTPSRLRPDSVPTPSPLRPHSVPTPSPPRPRRGSARQGMNCLGGCASGRPRAVPEHGNGAEPSSRSPSVAVRSWCMDPRCARSDPPHSPDPSHSYPKGSGRGRTRCAEPPAPEERSAPLPRQSAAKLFRRAPSTEHRAPSTERRAPSAEHRAPSAERGAPSAERRAPSTRKPRLSRRALKFPPAAAILEHRRAALARLA